MYQIDIEISFMTDSNEYHGHSGWKYASWKEGLGKALKAWQNSDTVRKRGKGEKVKFFQTKWGNGQDRVVRSKEVILAERNNSEGAMQGLLLPMKLKAKEN